MIPRRFFWLFDFLILSLTFLAAYSLVPRRAPLFAPGGPLLYQSRTRIVLGSFVAPLAEQDDGAGVQAQGAICCWKPATA